MSLLALSEDIAAILILSLIFYYWHNVLEVVVSDLRTFRVTASAEGCLHGIFQREIILNVLVISSASIEYLCHESVPIIHALLFQCGDGR